MSLIAHVGIQSGGNDYTTSNIDTRGAKLLVMVVSFINGASVTYSDSAGNTWTGLTVQSATRHSIQIRYVINPITSSAHNFSGVQTGSGGNGAMCVLAFNDPVLAFNVQNGFAQAGTGNTTIQPGSITPAQPSLAVAGWSLDDPTNTTWTVNSGFTISDVEDVIPGTTFGAVAAYIDPTAPGAVNPTFTRSNANTTGSDAAAIASFTVASIGSSVGRSLGPGRHVGSAFNQVVRSPLAYVVPDPFTLRAVTTRPLVNLGKFSFILQHRQNQGSFNPVVVVTYIPRRTLMGIGI